jgi:hypothetical protein
VAAVFQLSDKGDERALIRRIHLSVYQFGVMNLWRATRNRPNLRNFRTIDLALGQGFTDATGTKYYS